MEIRLLDASTQRVLAQKSLSQATVEQVANQLPGLAQELMAPLLREQQGFLVVKSKEEAAEILVDDTLVGSIPLKASDRPVPRHPPPHGAQGRFHRADPLGAHRAEADHRGGGRTPALGGLREDLQGQVREDPVGRWIATGVAVAGITTAILMNSSANGEYNDQFKPRQAWLQGAAGTGPQTKPPDISNNPTASAAWDSCTASGAVACKQAAEDTKSSVQVKQYVAIGTAVVGVAAAGVATWLWLSGKDPNRYAEVVAGVSPNPQGGMTLALAGRF